MIMEPKSYFRKNLPRALFYSDGKQRELFHDEFRIHFARVEFAIKARLLQYNHKHNVTWLAYDCDRQDSGVHWQDVDAPAPNLLVINRNNGHSHLFYGLETGVHRNEHSSQKALRYMGAIDVALTAKLDADPGYAKLLAKNPFHPEWLVVEPRDTLYDLAELADYLDLSPYRDKRRHLPAIGEGRNCTLFERLRKFAYTERRKAEYLNLDFFTHAVLSRGLAINTEFTPPLPHAEVRATARSVSKWAWNKMSVEGFREWGKKRRDKSLALRRKKAKQLEAAILETWRHCPELTQQEIADLCSCSRPLVNKVLWENF
jgi:hypothetical protein